MPYVALHESRSRSVKAMLWAGRLATWPLDHARFARWASLAVIAIQAILSVAAAVTLVALHGDGAWFVFTIATSETWVLKWASLASRFSTYFAVVVPTELAADALHLRGTQIAMLYGFLFNFVQMAQFAVCVMLGWRRHSKFLIFPLAQYALANGLGFGFMSESLIGPGFFWICFFLVLNRPFSLVAFVACFAGAMFSHELVIPSALMAVVFAWSQRDRTAVHAYASPRDMVLASACCAVVIIWLIVRFWGGGAGADLNPLATFDPRRIVDNPTLWVMIPGLTLLVAVGHAMRRKLRWRGLVLVTIAAFAITAALRPWLNIAQGKYDSARTLVGLELLFFGGWAIAAYVVRPSENHADDTWSFKAMIPMMICAALGVNLGADVAFLLDWVEARQGFERLAQPDNSSIGRSGHLGFLPYHESQPLLSRAEVEANDRMGFPWTWPFRSAVLAQDYSPRIVVFDEDPITLYEICLVLRPAKAGSGSVPYQTIQDLKSLSCGAPEPLKTRRFFGRLYDRLRSIFSSAPR